MESYNVIVLIFGIIIFILLISLYFVNRILQYKTRIDNSFLAVKEILEDDVQIVNNILEFLEKNLEHEKSYYKKLSKCKDMLVSIKNDKEGIQLIKKVEKDIYSFVMLENTYKNLTKNKDYIKIKKSILDNKEKLVYAMDSYDKGVISYNNYRSKQLIYILSKLCRIPEYDCYNK